MFNIFFKRKEGSIKNNKEGVEKPQSPNSSIHEAKKLLETLEGVPHPSTTVEELILNLRGSIKSLQNALDEKYNRPMSEEGDRREENSIIQRQAALIDFMKDAKKYAVVSEGTKNNPFASTIMSGQPKNSNDTPQVAQDISPEIIKPVSVVAVPPAHKIDPQLENLRKKGYPGLSAQEADVLKSYYALLSQIETERKEINQNMSVADRTRLYLRVDKLAKDLGELQKAAKDVLSRLPKPYEANSSVDLWRDNEPVKRRHG